MCEPGWLPAMWVEPDKHAPPRGRLEWADFIARTGMGRCVAKYRPGFTNEHIRQLEMSHDRDEGEELTFEFLGTWYRTSCERLARKKLKMLFCIAVEGLEIGGSRGEETNMLLVNRAKSGHVHGYPITGKECDDIRKKERSRDP